MTMTTQPKPHWLVAYIDQDGRYPIIQADALMADELDMCGWSLGDQQIAPPIPASGLWLWEGVGEERSGPDPDVVWRGHWRRLTDDELARLSRGEVVRE